MKRFVVLFLLMAAWLQAATYYIATDGNDTTGDGSEGTPWATFTKVLNSSVGAGPHTCYVAAGDYSAEASDYIYATAGADGKTITFQNATSTKPTIKTASTNYCLWTHVNMTTGHLIFDGINFAPAGESLVYGVLYSTSVGASVTIKNCTITIPDTCTRGLCRLDAVAASTRNITFDTCTINGRMKCRLEDCLTFTIKDCTITEPADETTAAFPMAGTNGSGTFLFENNSMTSGANGIFSLAAAAIINTIHIKGGSYTTVANSNGVGLSFSANDVTIVNTIIEDASFHTGKTCISILYDIQFIRIQNNTCRVRHDTVAGIPIVVGVDGASNAHPIGKAYITGNVCGFTGADNSHGMLIGAGADGAEVGGNFVTGGDIQLVVKARYSHVFNNILVGTKPMVLKGCFHSNVNNNTCVSTGDYAFSFIEDSESNFCYGNVITNNILDGSGGTYAFKDQMTGNPQHNNIFDYNCYVAGSSGLAEIAGTVCANLAAMQAKWQGFTNPIFVYGNDQHSLNINPALDANYKATSSALQNAGSPILLKSDGTVLLRNPIGATAGAGTEKSVFGVKRSVFGN